MATVLIDKLLEACVKQGASDIHITVGQPPVFRLHGRMRKLETNVLGPDDTVALMKSITPDRCQRELQERAVDAARLVSSRIAAADVELRRKLVQLLGQLRDRRTHPRQPFGCLGVEVLPVARIGQCAVARRAAAR